MVRVGEKDGRTLREICAVKVEVIVEVIVLVLVVVLETEFEGVGDGVLPLNRLPFAGGVGEVWKGEGEGDIDAILYVGVP